MTLALLTAATPLPMSGVSYARIYAQARKIFHGSASALTSQRQLPRNLFM